MAAVDEFRQWFESDVKNASWDENVKVHNLPAGQTEVRFFTDVNEYIILLTEDANGAFIESSVRSRKPRAGQDASALRRLLPSVQPIPLTQRIWRKLLNAIVGMELVRVQRQAPREKSEGNSERVSAKPGANFVRAEPAIS